MAKYIVRFSIDGEIEIEAESREAAQEEFEMIDARDLLECPDLTADDPKTPEEIAREIAEFRAQAAVFD